MLRWSHRSGSLNVLIHASISLLPGLLDLIPRQSIRCEEIRQPVKMLILLESSCNVIFLDASEANEGRESEGILLGGH